MILGVSGVTTRPTPGGTHTLCQTANSTISHLTRKYGAPISFSFSGLHQIIPDIGSHHIDQCNQLDKLITLKPPTRNWDQICANHEGSSWLFKQRHVELLNHSFFIQMEMFPWSYHDKIRSLIQWSLKQSWEKVLELIIHLMQPIKVLDGSKHGKVDSSWSLLMFKWKWSKTIY